MPYNVPKFNHKDSKKEVMRKLLHGKSPYQSIDRQSHDLQNVKKRTRRYASKKSLQRAQRKTVTTSQESK